MARSVPIRSTLARLIRRASVEHRKDFKRLFDPAGRSSGPADHSAQGAGSVCASVAIAVALGADVAEACVVAVAVELPTTISTYTSSPK